MNLYDLISDYLNDSNGSLKQLITWFLNEVMEQEAVEQSGAIKYERIASRKTQRNGYLESFLTTIHGKLILLKPQLRDFAGRLGIDNNGDVNNFALKLCDFVEADFTKS